MRDPFLDYRHVRPDAGVLPRLRPDDEFFARRSRPVDSQGHALGVLEEAVVDEELLRGSDFERVGERECARQR